VDYISGTTSSFRFSVLTVPFSVIMERDFILLFAFILFEKLESINVMMHFMNSFGSEI
jgi:hypothetical protein